MSILPTLRSNAEPPVTVSVGLGMPDLREFEMFVLGHKQRGEDVKDCIQSRQDYIIAVKEKKEKR